MSRQIQIRRGTAAENDAFTGAIGEITMDTTNNTLRVHDGATAGGTKLAKQSEIPTPYTMPSNYDFVIETQLPTSANNYTWYRKYKSGWVEQGGRVPGNTNGSYNITMPVEMADTNYNFIGTGYKDSNDAGFVAVCIDSSSVSTTGFRVYPRYAHNGSTGTPSQGGQWQVSGIAAS